LKLNGNTAHITVSPAEHGISVVVARVTATQILACRAIFFSEKFLSKVQKNMGTNGTWENFGGKFRSKEQ